MTIYYHLFKIVLVNIYWLNAFVTVCKIIGGVCKINFATYIIVSLVKLD